MRTDASRGRYVYCRSQDLNAHVVNVCVPLSRPIKVACQKRSRARQSAGLLCGIGNVPPHIRLRAPGACAPVSGPALGVGRLRSRRRVGSWRRTLAFAPPSQYVASDACVRASASALGVGRLRSRLGVGHMASDACVRALEAAPGVGRLRSRLGVGLTASDACVRAWRWVYCVRRCVRASGSSLGLGRLRSRLGVQSVLGVGRSRSRLGSGDLRSRRLGVGVTASDARVRALPSYLRVGRLRSRLRVGVGRLRLRLGVGSGRRTLAFAPRNRLLATDACVRAWLRTYGVCGTHLLEPGLLRFGHRLRALCYVLLLSQHSLVTEGLSGSRCAARSSATPWLGRQPSNRRVAPTGLKISASEQGRPQRDRRLAMVPEDCPPAFRAVGS